MLTESSLFNYAGMWLRGTANGQIQAVFPHYPKEKQIRGDRTEVVTSREDFIAKADAAQPYPWRVLMIERTDTGLLTNQLPYLLGRPSVGDYSWVKPGKVQWDWWNGNNIWGVDFRAGINNDTYKYYIDFAAKYGLEYVLLDEGWCDTRNLLKQVPGINVEELAAYAKQKKVDLLLWTSWLVLDKQLDTALDLFAKWDIKGIKVDFMQRDDQDMVNYYERVTKATAARKMMVSFHGAYKPTGWLRSYPNLVSSEGVRGNENNKWENTIDPEHTTTIPFIRMAAGPMDFTPGGMLNAQKNAFGIVYGEPMTLGTRCNQLAMYVIFESPLQMLCDMPTHYYREPEAMEFLKTVPVEWTRTVPLQAKVGDYVAMARQSKKGEWFIGVMTDWTARELSLNLSFLDEGKYKMYVWKDGINADRNAKDSKMETLEVDKNTVITAKMTTGGGYVARLVKQ
jgi:alpha-glucosidase